MEMNLSSNHEFSGDMSVFMGVHDFNLSTIDYEIMSPWTFKLGYWSSAITHTSTGASVATRFCCAWKADGGQLERRCEAGRVKKKVMKRETAQRGVLFGAWLRKVSKCNRPKKERRDGPWKVSKTAVWDSFESFWCALDQEFSWGLLV